MINLSALTTSWTKYDIVQVLDVLYDQDTFSRYISGDAEINKAVLRAFIGINSFKEPVPEFWYEIFKFPKEKGLFGMFALIFTHHEIISKFADVYSTGEMKGIYTYEPDKKFTNIRSALVESGAADRYLRRSQKVPYDFSPIFSNLKVGKLFKSLIWNRLSRITSDQIPESKFYEVCFENKFHTAISANKDLFKSWCEGKEYRPNDATYIKKIEIENFYSISEAYINLPENTREVYFLGENGDGKSLMLMAIYLAFNKNYVLNNTEKELTGKVEDLLESNSESSLSGEDSKGRRYEDRSGIHIETLFAYGTYRGRYSTDNSEKYGFMSLFDNNETLTNPISWLKNKKLIELTTKEGEIIDVDISIENVQTLLHELLEKNIEIKFVEEKVVFVEKGRELLFDQLSEGYRSIVIFIVDLILRLQESKSSAKSLDQFSGIVLVDEIGLHLHPKWQRSIIGELRKIFPNIQFFFTTHSPNIIQGASDDAVIYRVYRNSEDGVTKLSDPYFRKDIGHLMINSLITSPLFGLTDSRLSEDNSTSDTSEDYLQYRIHKKLEQRLEMQRKNGKEFISDEAIDNLIDEILDEELK